MQLQEISPEDGGFLAWCEVWAAGERLDRPGQPERPVSNHLALGRALVAPGGSRDGAHWTAMVDGRLAGALRVILPMQDNLRLAVVDVAVHPDYRRQGLGTALLRYAVGWVAQRGRSELLAEVDEPGPGTAGALFAERRGWTCELRETRRDLLVPVDEERLAALEHDARSASFAYELLRWRDRTPDALVEDRALLERRMTTDAPHGNLPVEDEHWDASRVREYEAMHTDRGRTVLSAGAVHDGRLVAFTDLQIPLANPRTAHQSGTLVLREHRGHRLGALIKAAVLRDLAAADLGVKRITTTNAEWNSPMVAVNEALGFVPAGQLTTWTYRL